jgi:hypothetical protein
MGKLAANIQIIPTAVFPDRWYPRAGLPNLSLASGKGGRTQTKKILIQSVNIFDRLYKSHSIGTF